MEEKKFLFLAGKYDSVENINSNAPEIGQSETWGEATPQQKEAGKAQEHQLTLQKLRKEREIEENEDSPLEKRMMVIDGATLKCPYAQSEGKLKVTSNELHLQDQIWTTEGDCANMVNLQFQGVSTILNGVQINLPVWE